MLPEQSPSVPSVWCLWQKRPRAIWQLEDIGLKRDRANGFSCLMLGRRYQGSHRRGFYHHHHDGSHCYCFWWWHYSSQVGDQTQSSSSICVLQAFAVLLHPTVLVPQFHLSFGMNSTSLLGRHPLSHVVLLSLVIIAFPFLSLQGWQLHSFGGIWCVQRDNLSGRGDENRCLRHPLKTCWCLMVSVHEMLICIHFCLSKADPFNLLVFLVAWSFAWEYNLGCLDVLSHCLQTPNLFQLNRLWYLALGCGSILECLLFLLLLLNR